MTEMYEAISVRIVIYTFCMAKKLHFQFMANVNGVRQSLIGEIMANIVNLLSPSSHKSYTSLIRMILEYRTMIFIIK